MAPSITRMNATGPRPPRRPTFLWQAALVVLPVVVLAALGLVSLRQDRALAEQQAKESAQVLANQLARAAGENVGHNLSIARPIAYGRVDASGRPLIPPDYPRSPSPPGWLTQLTAEQFRLWQAVQTAAVVGPAEDANVALQRLLATDPPDAAGSNAEFLLLGQNSGSGQSGDLSTALIEFARRHRDVTAASGLPLGQLAMLQALRRLPASGRLTREIIGSVADAVLNTPSVLSPVMLREAEQRMNPRPAAGADAAHQEQGGPVAGELAAVQAAWDWQERVRTMLDALGNQRDLTCQTNTIIWFEAQDHESLAAVVYPNPEPLPAVSTPADADRSNQGFDVSLFPASRIELTLQSVFASSAIPAYAQASVQIGDRRFDASATPSTRPHSVANPQLLAEVTAPFSIKYQRPADAMVVSTSDVNPAPSPSPPGETIVQFRSRLSAPAVSEFAVTARIYLTDASLLYARQRQRVWLFSALILTAAVMAFIGLVAAQRAFARQLRLSEMKSNFVSSVSHELRAPIASVRLLAENLDRGKVTDEAKRRDYFRLIGQECRRLSALIENALDFSRIDQGRKRYEFEPTDLAELVRQTVEVMQPYAAERCVHLDFVNPQPSTLNPQPDLDGRAIQQALVNLIDNAVKHSPAGETVVVSLDSPSPSLNHQTPTINHRLSTINLSVRDHGPGIPAAEHGRIFEPFYRRGSELRRETPGVGIGLTIVQHIVAAHGGQVRVESEVGKGSRFIIELPVRNDSNSHPG
jgi:signal transduction histidine kinase